MSQSDDKAQEQLRARFTQLSYELEQLQGQFQYLNQQTSALASHIQDLARTIESIAELIARKSGEIVNIPIGPRILLPVTIAEEANGVLINVGSNIHRRGSLQEAKGKLETEITQSRKVLESLQNELSRYEQEIARREQVIAQFYR